MQRLLSSIAVMIATLATSASSADLSFPPDSPASRDLNQAPLGQSFTAAASDVHGGLYVADAASFESWGSANFPGQVIPGSYPYAIAPSITVQIDLLEGEGTTGAVLYSTSTTLTAPFSGFVDVDYGAAGVILSVGQKYTLLLTDVSGQSYPQGVSGWIVPAATYADGLPVLQDSLATNDPAAADNSFEVIDNIVSGSNAVITAYVARSPGFIVINGGQNLLDHLWTVNLNPNNTTFLGGLVNWFKTGLLVDYTGIATSQGVILTQLTVKPAAPAPALADASLPDGTVGVAYLAAINIAGGLPPFNTTASDLPPGLAFDGTSVVGTPTLSGVYALTVVVSDALGQTATGSLTLSIAPAPAHYTDRSEGEGRISAIGEGYFVIGARKVFWDSTTRISAHSTVQLGAKAEWKGLRDPATGDVLAARIEIE